MALTKEELEEITTDAFKNIKARITKDVEDGIVVQIKEQIRYIISDEVATFFRDEIVPAIKENLLEEKPNIITAVAVAGNEISKVLVESLVKQATENLGQSWTRGTIFKELFK